MHFPSMRNRRPAVDEPPAEHLFRSRLENYCSASSTGAVSQEDTLVGVGPGAIGYGDPSAPKHVPTEASRSRRKPGRIVHVPNCACAQGSHWIGASLPTRICRRNTPHTPDTLASLACLHASRG
ncbi:putative transposase (fragment) protein [Xanthomonas albilineans GPE PC73]|uniref:Putative transposase protein n=1 Tax=Xanthomonas albilineans (strain GPE PC73 / CFBP 7063) TaxID=380358 RepID=D2U980_XANAP